MKINANLIRVGNVLKYNEKLLQVLNTNIIKPGKGGAYIQVEMRDLKSGTKINERWRTSDDIEKVSTLIYNYSCRWGMNNKIGALNPDAMGKIGENMNDEIFQECKNITDKIENFVIETLTKHKNYVKAIAKSLLRNETITYEEINKILPRKLENSLKIIKIS